MKSIFRHILVYIIILIAIGAIFSSYNLRSEKPEELAISDLIAKIEAEEIAKIEVEEEKITAIFNDDKKGVTRKESRESLSELLSNYGVSPEKIRAIQIEVKEPSGFAYWFGVLAPILLPVLILIALIWFMMRQVQGANMRALSFGQSGARQVPKNQKDRITFNDVAGVREAKEELMEVVEFLKNPKKFSSLGAKIPKGVLLMGHPGTGKTILARAVAGEANVPFFHISGSEFVEMFVGVGASVTGDTPVLVRDSCGTRLLPIAEFADQFYQKDETDKIKFAKNTETLSFEAQRWNYKGKEKQASKKFFGASAWKSVKAVYRHKAKEIYEIHYLGGILRATGDHSVFVRHKNTVIPKKADELRPGDILVNLPFKVRGSFVPEFGTTHKIKTHNWSSGNKIPKTLLFDEESFGLELLYSSAVREAKKTSIKNAAHEFGVSSSTIGNWLRGKHIPKGLTQRYAKAHPLEVPINEDLMRLLGYYTAEGRYCGGLEFVFGSHETNLHNDCISAMRKTFGMEPNLKFTPDNTLRIKYNYAPLGRFFKKYCETGSHNKHIPEFLWDAPRELFLAYLDGYTKGDGYVTREGKLSACSVSKRLIRELTWLCAMHGIPAGVREMIAPAGRILKNRPLPESKSWNLIIGKSSNPFEYYSSSRTQCKRPRIIKIIKKPYDGFVYDLVGCENEAFFGGEKPILLHNSRVRDLFAKAKKNAPCIIFIDEIDAVGRQRGSGLGGSHDEREQTLNQILVEMDGFDPNVGLVVLSGTNRPDVLDPALLRPGRFDRRVVLDLPDLRDREDILKIHARGKPLAEDVRLREIAERTPGFSGADLANLLNEAAILAARRNKRRVETSELREAVEKVLLGPERKSHILSPKEKEITAYHEGGHALTAHLLPNADPVHKVSVISRGRAAGYTLKLPIEDRKMHSRKEFIDDLAVMLGGYVAEKMIFNDVTTGASSDLRQATRLARKLITEYGMSEGLGPRTFGEKEELIFLGRELHEQRDYSEKLAEKIDEEIMSLIRAAQETAEKLLSENRETLDRIVASLLEKETLERDEFEKVAGPRPNPQNENSNTAEKRLKTKNSKI